MKSVLTKAIYKECIKSSIMSIAGAGAGGGFSRMITSGDSAGSRKKSIGSKSGDGTCMGSGGGCCVSGSCIGCCVSGSCVVCCVTKSGVC